MKLKLLLFCCQFAAISHCFGQEFKKHYKIKNEYEVGSDISIKYERNGYVLTKILAGKRLKADLIPDTAGRVKIHFWGITEEDPANTGSNVFVNTRDSTANFYFEIGDNPTLATPTRYKSIPYAVWQAGAVSVPFKYRFASHTRHSPADASTDFNAGIYVGRQWGRTRFYRDKDKNHGSISFTLAAFTGPTAINVKKENVRDTAKFTAESNEFGWSLGVGSLYAYRDLSFGMFLGMDIPFSSAASNWNYAYQPWLGIAIGYKLGVFGDK